MPSKNPGELRAFIAHLRTATEPFHIPVGAVLPVFVDRDRHQAAFDENPLRYALLAVLPDISDAARARIVFVTLAGDAAVSASGAESAAQIETATASALCLLPADDALQVFFALRHARVNRKRVSRLAVRFLLNHPAAGAFFACRRPAVRHILEHAIGHDVLAACVRAASQAAVPVHEAAYLHRKLLRFAQDADAAKRRIAGLTHGTTDASATEYRAVSDALRARYAPQPVRPDVVTADNRGDVTATLTALYRQTPGGQLATRFAQGMAQLAATAPRFAPGFRVALVLDTSASLAGYGEREYCLAASSATLWRLLCRVCHEPVAVFGTGEGEIIGSLPTLSGATDLATALLDALETKPDLVLVLTDGYENESAGDLARVAATLTPAGVETPVLLCLPQFTGRDDKTMRRPAPKLPELSFWHDAELPDLLRLAWLHTPEGADGMTDWIRTALLTRLKEETEWIHRR